MFCVSIQCFERHPDKTDAQSVVDAWVQEATKTEKSDKFAVILHNDPINGVEYVAKIIHAVFGYSMSKSIWLMLKAHFTGKSTLWIGPRHSAEQKRQQMIAYGPDPNMKARGAQPLTVTVEKTQ